METTITIKSKTAQQKYYEKNKDKMKEHMRNYYNNKINTDPDFKEKERERSKIKSKDRYDNDPIFREHINSKRLDLYYKNKADMLTSVTDIVTIEIVS